MARGLRHLLWVSLLLVACVSAGCDTQRSDTDRKKADTRFEENKSLFTAIRGAGQLTLFEGPPRLRFEPKHVEEEKQQKPTVTLHGFKFYATPLEVSAEDAAKLKGLLSDERTFLQWQGQKRCGGFHPDYLAEYQVGESTYRFLLCFGCHEAMVFGPDRSLRCDIQDEAFKELEASLTKYRKNRPATGSGERHAGSRPAVDGREQIDFP